MLRRITLLALFAVAVPLFAQVQWSITPDRGPVAGGTEVTIKGEFGSWPYEVFFGSTHVPATVIDATTLRATTPPHLPGPVNITVFEYDMGIATGLKFTFEGEAEDGFEPMLLPVFSAPIPGAHGSEFRTDLRVRLVKGNRADIFGLRYPCNVTCIQGDDPYVLIEGSPEAGPENIENTGTPGLLLYLAKDQIDRVRMNLRAYDTSRSAENFGTEIPIVRLRDFATTLDPTELIGIPSDPRFRNTLRIYGYGDTPAPLRIEIEGPHGISFVHNVVLPAQPDRYHPGYVEFSNFPVDAGMLRVRIIPPPMQTPHRWAFVSVTNNETQHITLITPQP